MKSYFLGTLLKGLHTDTKKLLEQAKNVENKIDNTRRKELFQDEVRGRIHAAMKALEEYMNEEEIN